MAKIISIHSMRRGIGKSQITANICTVLAATGYRVGIIDSDVTAPSIHSLFGVSSDEIAISLNDFLWGRCSIESTAYSLKHKLGKTMHGQVWLIPFVLTANEIRYDISLLSDSFELLIESLELDFLVIDTQPGMQPTSLPSLAFSDTEVYVLRPEQQAYQDTGVAIDIGKQLGIPERLLIVNQVPAHLDGELVRHQIEATYQCDVIAVLPHAAELAQPAQQGIWVLQHPEHPLTSELLRAAARLSI